MRDDVLREAFGRRNAIKKVAAVCEISTAAVSQWRRVPAHHLDKVAAELGVSADALRPDLAARSAA